MRIRPMFVPGAVLVLFLGALAWLPTVHAADEPRAAEPSAPEQMGGRAEPEAGEPHGGLAPNCRAEIKQLCQGIEPGGGRIRRCIKENEGKLSAPCRQEIEAKRAQAKARMQEAKEACEPDIRRLCPDVKPGGGGIAGCLREHAKELSPACAQATEPLRHRGRSSRQAPPPLQAPPQ